MIVQVVIHEVLYSAHTDGFERIKKTLSIQARWTKYGKRYSRGESHNIVVSFTVLFSTDIAQGSWLERGYPPGILKALKLRFTEVRSGESPVCTGIGDRIPQGPKFQVACWSELSDKLVAAPQIKNVYMCIHAVRKLPAGVGIEGPLHCQLSVSFLESL
jgi:hypothetical protein